MTEESPTQTSDNRCRAEETLEAIRASHPSLLNEIRLAAGFLTVIPIGTRSGSVDELARSMGWFPLIGFTLGAVLAGTDYLLAFIFPSMLRSLLIVLALAGVTGAVHIDGLADTADALGAGCDRDRALEILRDSRIGTFGAAAIFFVLALKTAALTSAVHSRLVALYLSPGLARWAMVAVPYKIAYLRERGAGSALLGVHAEHNLRIACVVTLLACVLAGTAPAIRAIIVAAFLSWILRAFYVRWLGGVTGDLIGSAGEIVEAAVMIALTC